MPRAQRFTAYDMMEARGDFRKNPANVDSDADDEGNPIYKGPVEYPKMLYHPEGETEVIVAGQAVTHPTTGEVVVGRDGQPVVRGEQRQIIYRIARDAAEEAALRDDGWHDHPAKAIEAGGGTAPAVSSQAQIDSLRGQVERLQKQLAAAESLPAASRSAPAAGRRSRSGVGLPST